MSDLDNDEVQATRKLNGLDDELFKEKEIENGEYVRTKNGEIYKLADKKDYDFIRDKFYFQITKHSKQLIDLIECGDFVNGYKVISVDYDVMNDTTECIELDLNSNYQYNFISIRQIKTILTKESYMANCYKVGEE